MGISLALLWYSYKTLDVKNSQIGKQNEQLNLINNKLIESNNIIKEKKNELTTELKMQLIFISSFTNQLGRLKKMIKKNEVLDPMEKKKIFSALSFDSKLNTIKNINIKFLDLNASFISALSTKYPKLTSNDLNLCIYLKMNMSTKEIAQIQFKTVDSVKVARSRLRKKLGVSGSDTKLSSFLNSLEKNEICRVEFKIYTTSLLIL